MNDQSKLFTNFMKHHQKAYKAGNDHGCYALFLRRKNDDIDLYHVGDKETLLTYLQKSAKEFHSYIPKTVKTDQDKWLVDCFEDAYEHAKLTLNAVKKIKDDNLYMFYDHPYRHSEPKDIRPFTAKDLMDAEMYVNNYPERLRKFKAFKRKYLDKGPEVNLPTKIFNLITDYIIDNKMPTDNLISDKDGITSIGAIDDLIVGCNHYIKYYSKLQTKRTMYDYTNIKVELYGLHHVLMYLKHLHKSQIHNIYIVNWMRTMVRPLTVKDIKKRFGLNGSDINKFVQWLKGSADAKDSLIKKLKI